MKINDILEFELGDYLERRQSARNEAEIGEIEEEVWNKYGGTWAVMCTDLSGFSKNAWQHGILYTLSVIHTFRTLAMPIIANHGGSILKTEGDSLIITFDEVKSAVDAAVDIRSALETYNAAHHGEEVFNASGIGYGRMIRLGDNEMFGVELNLASKLGEDIAEKDEILMTEAAKSRLDEAYHSKNASMEIETEAFKMDEQLGLKAYRVIR